MPVRRVVYMLVLPVVAAHSAVRQAANAVGIEHGVQRSAAICFRVTGGAGGCSEAGDVSICGVAGRQFEFALRGGHRAQDSPVGNAQRTGQDPTPPGARGALRQSRTGPLTVSTGRPPRGT